MKREATGGWLAPILLVVVLAGGTLAGLWYYFAPQIAIAGKGSLVATAAVQTPSARVSDSAGLKNTSSGAREKAVTVVATPVPSEVTVSLSDDTPPPRRPASSPPPPEPSPAAATTAPAPPLLSSTPTREQLLTGARALSKAVGALASPSPIQPAPTPSPTPSPEAVVAATPALDPVRQLALAHSKDPQLSRRSAVPAAIVLGEEAFSTGRTYMPGQAGRPLPARERRAARQTEQGGSPAGAPASGLAGLASVLRPSSPAAAVADLDESNFQSFLQQHSSTPVVVDFWASWCGPCRKFAPIMESVAAEYGGKVRFARVNVEENEALARRFRVRSLPTLVIFRGGSERQRVEGGMSAGHLKNWVEASR